MTPSIRNTELSAWSRKVGVTGKELKQWVFDKFGIEVAPQGNEGWAELVLLALQLQSGIRFSEYEDITTQFDDPEKVNIGLTAGADSLNVGLLSDEIDWGEYANVPKWMQKYVVWKHWSSQIVEGNLIFDEDDKVQMALHYERVWLDWDSSDILNVRGAR